MKEEGFTKSFKLIEGLGQAQSKGSSLSCLGVSKKNLAFPGYRSQGRSSGLVSARNQYDFWHIKVRIRSYNGSFSEAGGQYKGYRPIMSEKEKYQYCI